MRGLLGPPPPPFYPKTRPGALNRLLASFQAAGEALQKRKTTVAAALDKSVQATQETQRGNNRREAPVKGASKG